MKKNLKFVSSALALILCLSLLAGCRNSSAADPAGIRVAALKGPTALGMLDIMDKAEKGQLTDTLTFTLASSPDEILGDIIQGNYDIAAIPANVAALLYNKTDGKVQLLAINTLGVFYVLSSDSSITSVSDLRGRTIVTTGQGATPEYSLNYVLRQNGLEPGTDVTIEYRSESAEVGSAISAGQADVVMLPQPFVTSVLAQNEGWSIVLDLDEEWNKVCGGTGLVSGCVVVQKAFAQEHPEAVARFLDAYEASVRTVKEDPAAAGDLAEHFDILKAAVAARAIPYCHIVFIDGADMQKTIEGYYGILYDADPASVGGAVPSEDFYYITGTE